MKKRLSTMFPASVQMFSMLFLVLMPTLLPLPATRGAKAQEPFPGARDQVPPDTVFIDEILEIDNFPPADNQEPEPELAPADPAGTRVSESPDNDMFELVIPAAPDYLDHGAEDIPAPVAPELVSVSFDEVPVPDVVNMFSRITGANIIVAGVFTNYLITANLQDVQWRTALNLLLGSVGLSTIEDPSGILMVVTSEEYEKKVQALEDTRPLVTRVFAPRYLNPVDLVDQVREMNVLSRRGRVVTSQSREQHLSSLKSSEATVRPFAESEARQNPSITTVVVVTDMKEYVERIEALIAQLDRREPQVFIEARIIDIVSSDGSKFGFDWEMLDAFGISARFQDMSWSWSDTREDRTSRDARDLRYDERSFSDRTRSRYDMHGRQYEEVEIDYVESPPDSGRWLERTRIIPTREIDDEIRAGREIRSEYGDAAMRALERTRTASAILSASEVSLMLSALRKSGNAKMLSHPSLIVGNRVESKIHVGETTWQIMMIREPGRDQFERDVYSEQATPVDLGLKLWVIPEIDFEDRVVRMTVSPEMTVFVEDIITAQGSVYPVTSTRNLSTRVNVPSGETLVIGGLIEYAESKREKKVPFLGDVPLLGMLFRHTQNMLEKHNLVIMLTPTILDDTLPATGYEAMGWQAVEDFEMVPLSPREAPARRSMRDDGGL